jgi:hypothetical protein
MHLDPSRPLGAAGWLAVGVLAGFLAGAVFYFVRAWGDVSDVSMPPAGWLFLVLGAIVTIAVGAGLMGLLFYSSRHGKDF